MSYSKATLAFCIRAAVATSLTSPLAATPTAPAPEQPDSVASVQPAHNTLPAEIEPWHPDAPWLQSTFGRQWFDSIPIHLHEYLYVNSQPAYETFHDSYLGTLWRWHASVTDLPKGQQLPAIASKLQAHYQQHKHQLQAEYPAFTDNQLKLAHATKLAHGHYQFGPNASEDKDPLTLITTNTADCSEYACLTSALASLHGVDSRVYGLYLKFDTPPLNNPEGPTREFFAGHQVASAEGLILDAEINMILEIDLNDPELLDELPEHKRFETLIEQGRVHPSYNWLIRTDIRAQQHARQNDGGIIAFGYAYYVEAFSSKHITEYNESTGNHVIYEQPQCRYEDLLDLTSSP